jgi:hypothetical protein
MLHCNTCLHFALSALAAWCWPSKMPEINTVKAPDGSVRMTGLVTSRASRVGENGKSATVHPSSERCFNIHNACLIHDLAVRRDTRSEWAISS